MENHPIPQDITGFQFKLVGKMTVRQFIYVGVGVFLAWLIYFVLKFPLFLSLPLALFFSLGGAALAFLPIDGRPMDVMIKNFINSVIAPTQYVYEKQGGSAFSPGQTHVGAQVSQVVPTPTPTPNQEVAAPSSPGLTNPQLTHMQNPSPSIPTPPIEQVNSSIQPSEEQIENEEKAVEKEEEKIEEEIKTSQADHEETSKLEEQLNEVMRQKEELQKELEQLKAKLNDVPINNPAPAEPIAPDLPNYQAAPQPPVSAPVPPPPPPIQTMPQFPPASEVNAPSQNLLPEEPNVIKGTVKDSRGNPLQNILVEVKDEEENPVRAFKTNSKGEFASATSLPNGNYTIVLEDPKMVHKFDTSSITATGGPITPLGIISIDPREELRRELFN